MDVGKTLVYLIFRGSLLTKVPVLRECPGVNFSTSFLYALFACILRCFDIAVIEGDEPKREYEGEIIS